MSEGIFKAFGLGSPDTCLDLPVDFRRKDNSR